MKEIIDSPKINFRNLHDITNNWAMALKNLKKKLPINKFRSATLKTGLLFYSLHRDITKSDISCGNQYTAKKESILQMSLNFLKFVVFVNFWNSNLFISFASLYKYYFCFLNSIVIILHSFSQNGVSQMVNFRLTQETWSCPCRAQAWAPRVSRHGRLSPHPPSLAAAAPAPHSHHATPAVPRPRAWPTAPHRCTMLLLPGDSPSAFLATGPHAIHPERVLPSLSPQTCALFSGNGVTSHWWSGQWSWVNLNSLLFLTYNEQQGLVMLTPFMFHDLAIFHLQVFF